MVQVRWLHCAALVAGCGRVGFDAGTGDDAGADPFVARICDRYPGAVYCNDFEDGLGSALGNVGGTLVPTGGFGGSAGISFTADGGEMPGAVVDVAPVMQGTLWMAGRMRVEPGPFSNQYLVLVQATGANFDKVSFDLVDLDTVQVVNSVDNNGAKLGPDGGFPRGRWFCFELGVDVGAASAQGVTLRIDDQIVVTGWEGLSTLPPGGFVRVEIAAYAGPANAGAITVTYDNWVVQTQPIGCP